MTTLHKQAPAVRALGEHAQAQPPPHTPAGLEHALAQVAGWWQP